MPKILVLYAYHESEEGLKNLKIFNQFGMTETENIEYRLIINGFTCSLEKDGKLNRKWRLIICRSNEGYDFSAWYDGLREWEIDRYDYFIFLNDTVSGPFVTESWISSLTGLLTDQVKLAGLTVNFHTQFLHYPVIRYPHVQSMLFATDRVGIRLIYPKIINGDVLEKRETIDQKEIGLSRTVLEAGYQIGCLLDQKIYGAELPFDYRTFYLNQAEQKTDTLEDAQTSILLKLRDNVWFNGYYDPKTDQVRCLRPDDIGFFKTCPTSLVGQNVFRQMQTDLLTQI